MMKWLIPACWGFCRLLAWICQLAGFFGILLAILIGIWKLAGRLEGL